MNPHQNQAMHCIFNHATFLSFTHVEVVEVSLIAQLPPLPHSSPWETLGIKVYILTSLTPVIIYCWLLQS